MITKYNIQRSIRNELQKKSKREVQDLCIKLLIEKKGFLRKPKKLYKKKHCMLCGDNEDLKLHHLKPRCLGGKDIEKNLITLCHYCHWYLHSNPKFKIHHSKLTKEGLKKARLNGRFGGRPRKL